MAVATAYTSQKPHLTGFCGVGQHEGTKPRGHNGKPLKVCEFWQVCTCDCHKQITAMFEMSGRERVPVPNPEYVPYQRDFWMPSDDPDFGLPEAHPDVAEGGQLVVTDRQVQVTEGGRTRKGDLEYAVQRVCLDWNVEKAEYCTVKYISETVFANESAALDKPPSLGAVAAVLSRWEKYGYALLGTKPVRFVMLTPQGREKGLEWCRANFKKK